VFSDVHLTNAKKGDDAKKGTLSALLAGAVTAVAATFTVVVSIALSVAASVAALVTVSVTVPVAVADTFVSGWRRRGRGGRWS
jgi:hypothetical protein